MKFFKDYRHKYNYEFDGLLTKCTARSHVKIADKSIPVRGYGEAECHKEDVYNKEFGCELSKIRAKRELCEKIENVFIEQTKKREWNKAKLFNIVWANLIDNLQTLGKLHDQ